MNIDVHMSRDSVKMTSLVQKPGYCKNTISRKTRLKFFYDFLKPRIFVT